ncbi:MAG: hypothetical protein LBH11_00470 [Propionibacteriaceae bacterium]|nr:hypothetical protein [Propionibacteriaceae bacterium]
MAPASAGIVSGTDVVFSGGDRKSLATVSEWGCASQASAVCGCAMARLLTTIPRGVQRAYHRQQESIRCLPDAATLPAACTGP